MDKLFIRELLVDALIGVHSHERNKKQPIYIDLELTVDISKAARTDRIDDAVCYETLSNAITHYVGRSEYFLIEALAENLAQYLLKQFSIHSIKLSIHKPNILPNAKAAGLVIER